MKTLANAEPTFIGKLTFQLSRMFGFKAKDKTSDISFLGFMLSEKQQETLKLETENANLEREKAHLQHELFHAKQLVEEKEEQLQKAREQRELLYSVQEYGITHSFRVPLFVSEELIRTFQVYYATDFLRQIEIQVQHLHELVQTLDSETVELTWSSQVNEKDKRSLYLQAYLRHGHVLVLQLLKRDLSFNQPFTSEYLI